MTDSATRARLMMCESFHPTMRLVDESGILRCAPRPASRRTLSFGSERLK
jgi:hypothetical protein